MKTFLNKTSETDITSFIVPPICTIEKTIQLRISRFYVTQHIMPVSTDLRDVFYAQHEVLHPLLFLPSSIPPCHHASIVQSKVVRNKGLYYQTCLADSSKPYIGTYYLLLAGPAVCHLNFSFFNSFTSDSYFSFYCNKLDILHKTSNQAHHSKSPRNFKDNLLHPKYVRGLNKEIYGEGCNFVFLPIKNLSIQFPSSPQNFLLCRQQCQVANRSGLSKKSRFRPKKFQRDRVYPRNQDFALQNFRKYQ